MLCISNHTRILYGPYVCLVLTVSRNVSLGPLLARPPRAERKPVETAGAR